MQQQENQQNMDIKDIDAVEIESSADLDEQQQSGKTTLKEQSLNFRKGRLSSIFNKWTGGWTNNNNNKRSPPAPQYYFTLFLKNLYQSNYFY